MSGVIMGKKAAAADMDQRRRTASAIGDILGYYRVKPVEVPESLERLDEQLEFLLRPSGTVSYTHLTLLTT